MEMYMVGFLVGILTAVIALTVFYIISKNKDKIAYKCKTSYDERQKKARGEASKVGFVTALAGLTILLIAEFVLTEYKIDINFILPLTFVAFYFIDCFRMLLRLEGCMAFA